MLQLIENYNSNQFFGYRNNVTHGIIVEIEKNTCKKFLQMENLTHFGLLVLERWKIYHRAIASEVLSISDLLWEVQSESSCDSPSRHHYQQKNKQWVDCLGYQEDMQMIGYICQL